MQNKNIRPFIAAIVFSASAMLVQASDKMAEPILKADDPTWNMDFSAAELIVVQDGGRKKPLQTYALESIEQMSGKPLMGATFVKIPLDPANEKDRKDVKFNAMDLFMSIWCYPEFWEDKPVILVPGAETRKLIDPNDPAGKSDKLISVKAIRGSSSLKETLKQIKTKIDRGEELTSVEKEAQLAYKRALIFDSIVNADSRLAIIPVSNNPTKEWYPPEVLSEISESLPALAPKAKQAAESLSAFKDAYRARIPGRFSQASRDLRESLSAMSPSVYPSAEAVSTEVKYNSLRPYGIAWLCYLAAVVFAAFGVRAKTRVSYYLAFPCYVAGLGLHIYGMALRCMIADRPPVSNMYESVVWVGFGAVMFGLVFELIYRKGIPLLAGAFGGFLLLMLMDLLPWLVGEAFPDGVDPRVNPLMPVLRDNFWLTVHVLTITLSYAAFMLAWGMGHITLYAHLVRPNSRIEHHELHQMVYRVLQVGVLLLTIGTMLGGVWAYYSWGRFWGWDSKETWALITLLCYLVVLHGRFAGLWGNFGNAFGSVFCFLSVVMAWYGVNFWIGSAKHGYGSGTGGMNYVFTLVGMDMIFLAAATTSHLIAKKNRACAGEQVEDDADVIDAKRGTPDEAISAGE